MFTIEIFSFEGSCWRWRIFDGKQLLAEQPKAMRTETGAATAAVTHMLAEMPNARTVVVKRLTPGLKRSDLLPLGTTGEAVTEEDQK